MRFMQRHRALSHDVNHPGPRKWVAGGHRSKMDADRMTDEGRPNGLRFQGLGGGLNRGELPPTGVPGPSGYCVRGENQR